VKQKFVALALSAMLFALCCSAEGQQTKTIPRIGFLAAGSPSTREYSVTAFGQGLHDLGYLEGKNILIEYRWAEGRFDRFAELAIELVRLKVRVIVAPQTVAALAAKNATGTIPIVTVTATDPVGSGLIASLARPEGNVTGLSQFASTGITGKQLELLKETLPKLTRVAVIANPANRPTASLLKEAEGAAHSLKVDVRVVEARSPTQLDSAFSAIKTERVDAFLVVNDPIFIDNRSQITSFAANSRLPAMYASTTYVGDGGLMSYGADIADLFRRAAYYVDKILKGAKPADLPVEQPKKFELVVNLKAAKQIGLTIPPNVLARADRVIK
jgi:putative ABC transport system substrate-binding protein